MTARRHHFLPQCYLRGFAHHREKPKLFVVDCKEGKSFTTNPVNIAQERDFHAVQVEGLAPDALEQALAKVESEIAPALERIARTGSIKSGDDRILVLNLAALIAVKNPRHRETMRDFIERIGKSTMQLALATRERWEAQVDQMKAAGYMSADEDADYEGMKEFVSRREYSIGVNTGAHLAWELSAFNGVLPTFIDRRWAVLRAPSRTAGFVTSDHPVCLRWSDPADHRGFHGPGHGLKDTTVTFPVSKEVALMGTFEAISDVEVDLNEEQVAALNSRIMGGADRRIFARDSSFEYQARRTGKRRRGADLPGEIVGEAQRRAALFREPSGGDSKADDEAIVDQRGERIE